MTTNNRAIDTQDSREDISEKDPHHTAFSSASEAVQARFQMRTSLAELNQYAKTVIEGAMKNYGNITGKKGQKDKNVKEVVWGAAAAALTFGKTSREDRIKKRIAVASNRSQQQADTLLLLLQDPNVGGKGCGLKSFRYMLATNFLGTNAKTDAEAAQQIEIAITELKTNLAAKWESTLSEVEGNSATTPNKSV